MGRQKRTNRVKTPRICRLCGEETILRQSHILPEFVYELTYEENRALSVAADGTGKVNTVQQGIWEWLLCDRCEGHFSRFESHAADVIREIHPRLRGAVVGEVVTVLADYRTFKLFLLSILWRAAVSKAANFRAVDLGRFEPIVHQMLQPEASAPGGVNFMPCFAIAPVGLQNFDRVVAPAGRGDLQSVPIVWLTFYGMHWFFAIAEIDELPIRMPVAATHLGFSVIIGGRSEAEEFRRILAHIGDVPDIV